MDITYTCLKDQDECKPCICWTLRVFRRRIAISSIKMKSVCYPSNEDFVIVVNVFVEPDLFTELTSEKWCPLCHGISVNSISTSSFQLAHNRSISNCISLIIDNSSVKFNVAIFFLPRASRLINIIDKSQIRFSILPAIKIHVTSNWLFFVRELLSLKNSEALGFKYSISG